MKKNKDVKFIIYQALYIFVICVIAIKGADLNLDEVEIKKLLDPRFAYIDTLENKIIRKEDFAKLIIFDSSKYLIVLKEDYKNNPENYVNNPLVIARNLNPENDNTIKNNNPDIKKIEEGSENITVSFPSNFVQYRQNNINNPNNVEMIVNSSSGSVSIPPKSSKQVLIMGDNTITLTSGGTTKSFSVKVNDKPKVNFERMATMNEESKVTQLQRTVCYRVKIMDDYPDQLDVKITGPLTFKSLGNGVFDVTMNMFGSRQVFDNYTDNRQSPYSAGFTVIVKDKISGHSITGQQQFVFGEW